MIRRTLPAVKAATFCVLLPNPVVTGLPTGIGTGFFVSPDGYFVTAAHVITDGQSNTVRPDLDQMVLQKEIIAGKHTPSSPPDMWMHLSLIHIDSQCDFALLKVEIANPAQQSWMCGRNEVPFVEVSVRPVEEGEPVFSFGYPLTDSHKIPLDSAPLGYIPPPGTTEMRTNIFCPRVTSAIIASRTRKHGVVQSTCDPIYT